MDSDISAKVQNPVDTNKVRALLDCKKLAVAVQVRRGMRTLKGASEESGLPIGTLSQIENEALPPGLYTYIRVCLWLEVSLDYFVIGR